MKVLLAASEAAPIVKLGGLGDVVGSLPKALEKIGVNCDIVIPFYTGVQIPQAFYKSYDLQVPFDNDIKSVEVFKTKIPNSNVDVFLLRNTKYFEKGSPKAFANNMSETEMFSFFDRCVVEFIKASLNTYDIVHCNDWHTGLITHLLEEEFGQERPKTLFTIHNILYQGIGDAYLVAEMGLTPGIHSLIDWDIRDGDINFMLQGITSSDYISTVSPSYAKEILTEEFGGGFDDILRSREGRLSGILNGIDYEYFKRDYDISNWQNIKKKYKKEILEESDIDNLEAPLYVFISRLDPNQKGLILLPNIIDEIVRKGGSFVMLGTGDGYWEEKFKDLEKKYTSKVKINITFDNKLANKLYSAADFLLAPSKYEPCGLIQMIAMWYGALPIVHAVGGLKDSVEEGVTGFLFNEYTHEAFSGAVDKSFDIYNHVNYRFMVENAMKADFSWKKSAQEYKKLYERITQ